jgi:hypothetical protein
MSQFSHGTNTVERLTSQTLWRGVEATKPVGPKLDSTYAYLEVYSLRHTL